ncbi:MAG: HNH endonuclease [Candidatus Dormibacteraeota bacterium]|nr:HNH endonuclease [Candidatus Dormibacteraeota bacterium]
MAIRRQIDRLEAESIRRTYRFDRDKGALSEGASSTVSWLRGTCGLTAAAAADRVRMARVLNELPQTAESFRAGRAPFTNVSLIARLAEDVGVEATRTVEDALVGAAEKVDTARMWYLTSFTRHRLDADGVLERDNRDHERRWFSCDQTFGGVYILRGELDAEGGAVVKTALNALSAPSGRGDERRGSQRSADALVELASRQLKSGSLPAAHGQRPHLTLTATLETLRRAEGAPPAELATAGPIHAETARRIACDSTRSDATAKEAGNPLSVGRASRTIPAPIRTALRLRDKGCRFPSCDRPPEWTDGHHIKHWADGGATALDNLVLLCRRHHRMVHESGWALRVDASGEVTVEEPHGRPALVRRL